MDVDVSTELALSTDDEVEEESATSRLSEKKIENLKISIDNEFDAEAGVTFVKLEPETQSPQSEDTAVHIIKPFLQRSRSKNNSYFTKDQVKVYSNSMAGNFEVGIDMSSEDAKSKREERAKRFGMENMEVITPQYDVESLYQSLGITPADLKRSGLMEVRTNTILLRGVNEMSTDDIFNYFAKYPPTSLEWIDDSLCNLIYANAHDCNRALFNMSHPITTKISAQTGSGVSKETSTGADNSINSLDGSLDINADNQTDSHETSEGNTTPNTCPSGAAELYIDESEVPPGKWRVGTSASNVKCRLFMRLATKGDIKKKGAERSSQYYRKYGNPNYGGMQGLISMSKKQRFWKQQNRKLEKEAKEVVAGSRSKVTYDEGDVVGDIYTENEADARSRLTENGSRERDSIQGKRKRGWQLTADTEDIAVCLDQSVPGKKSKPTKKMAADEEEERRSLLRLKAEAVFSAMDVRSNILQKREARRRELSVEMNQPIIKHEKVNPDLRNRLSRRNDWYS